MAILDDGISGREVRMDETRARRTGRGSFAVVSLLLAIALSASSCARQPIRLGLSLVLTGPSSRIGVTGRNGIELAAAEINAAGGIKGRPVELLIEDDGDSPEGAVAADEALYAKGIRVIIGHMSSRSGSKAIPWANEKGVLMLSPTISSEEWTGKDDWFLRVIGANSLQGKALAEHALKAGRRRVAGAYEYSNRAYSKNVMDSFAEAFRAGGGEFIELAPFTQGAGLDHQALAKSFIAAGAEAIVSVASAVDNAALCQALEKAGSSLTVYVGMWATTDDLIRNGGKTVERVVAAGTLDPNDRSPDYLAFRAAYAARFGEEPTFASLYGYESMKVLALALRKTVRGAAQPDPASLKKAIIEQALFPDLQSPIPIDSFGDSPRAYQVLVIRDAAFRRAD
jgi:branched-chain amino acid transport system substrate-binding protein